MQSSKNTLRPTSAPKLLPMHMMRRTRFLDPPGYKPAAVCTGQFISNFILTVFKYSVLTDSYGTRNAKQILPKSFFPKISISRRRISRKCEEKSSRWFCRRYLRGRGGKEKEWTDCVQSDIRAFGITGDDGSKG